MSAFIVILPESSEIGTEDVKQAFQRRYQLVEQRVWLVSDDECYDSSDVRNALRIGTGRSGLVIRVAEYAGYGDRALGSRLRKWVDE